MATASLLGPSVEPVVDDLWRTTEQYGFRATSLNFENERIKADFIKRLEAFVEKYLKMAHLDALPKATIFEVRRTLRLVETKGHIVELNRINELTLVWALVLLTHGYRGLDMDMGLDALKLEVLWLLVRFGYRTPEKCERFCTALNNWRKHSLLWIATRDYHAEEKGTDFVPGPYQPAHPACQECALVLNAAST